MSWMDSASGSSTFHGGGDHAGNNGPSGAGTGGRPGNGGNNYSQTGGLGGGLGTGTTWHGNTAFGPAGGNAVGYVSLKDGGSIFQGQRGMGPSVNTYSNFRKPDGSPMVGGNLQNRPVTARNPQQALAQLQAMQQAQQGTVAQTGGLLDDPGSPTQGVTVRPQSLDPFTGMIGGHGIMASNADIDPDWGGPPRNWPTQNAVVGGYGIPGYGLAAGMRTPLGTQNAVVGGYGTPGYGLSSGGGWR